METILKSNDGYSRLLFMTTAVGRHSVSMTVSKAILLY